MIAAAVEDAIRLRISNITCAVVLVTAIVAMALHGFPLASCGRMSSSSSWSSRLERRCSRLGQMGGGDIKLLACLGLWMNFEAAVWLVASTLIAGGVLALGFIATRPLRAREE